MGTYVTRVVINVSDYWCISSGGIHDMYDCVALGMRHTVLYIHTMYLYIHVSTCIIHSSLTCDWLYKAL